MDCSAELEVCVSKYTKYNRLAQECTPMAWMFIIDLKSARMTAAAKKAALAHNSTWRIVDSLLRIACTMDQENDGASRMKLHDSVVGPNGITEVTARASVESSKGFPARPLRCRCQHIRATPAAASS